MQKSKGLFLLKRAGLLALVLVFSGAQRAATPVGQGIPADLVVAEPGPVWYAGSWVLGGMDWVSGDDGAGGSGFAGVTAVGGVGNDAAGAACGAGFAGAGAGDVARGPFRMDALGTADMTAGPDAAAGDLGWMSIEEAAGKLQKEERPVLIDLYTTWCGWCKQMDRKTYSNKKVAAYLQDKFYPVKLDAETHSVITWKGKEYHFSTNYRSNEFAVYLTHGQLEFPTTIIIPPGGEPQAIPGYMEPKELELLVKYFGEGNFNKVGFDVFQKSFRPSW